MSLPEQNLRQSIIEMCLRLEAEGYLVGTYGNVSVRIPEEGLLVTPSRISYGDLIPSDLVTVDLYGQVLHGDRVPSSETSVHRLIYAVRPDIGAILHTHALHATALSCMHLPIPVIVEEQAQVLGGIVPCTRYTPAGRHDDLGQEAAAALGQSNAVMLANHGLVACGRTLEEAYFATQITERVAHMHLLTLAAGGAVRIADDHVKSERDRWLYRYGTAADGEASS